MNLSILSRVDNKYSSVACADILEMLVSPLQIIRKFFDIRSRIRKNAYFVDHSYDNLKLVCGREISSMPTSRFFSGWEAQDGDVFLIPEVTAINWIYEIKSG